MTADATWTGSMPQRYHSGLGEALFTPYAEHVAARARAWSPGRVLEVAAGTGIGTGALLDALPDADVVATDLNPAMVAWGSEHVPGATWQVADAQALDVGPGTFDLVVCLFGAMFFPDRPGAFAQMRDALAPGGRVVLTVWAEVEASDLPAALVASLREAFPADPPTFVERTPHGYADPDRIRADLEHGGLGDAEVDRVELQGGPVRPADFVAGVSLGTPLRFELEARGPLQDVVDDLAHRMEARLGSDPVAGRLTAYVATARAHR